MSVRNLAEENKCIDNTDTKTETDWVLNLWIAKNRDSESTAMEVGCISGADIQPEAKPVRENENKGKKHALESEEGKFVEKGMTNKGITQPDQQKKRTDYEAKVEGMIKRFSTLPRFPSRHALFSKVKSLCDYQVKIHDIRPIDIKSGNILSAVSLAEEVNYTCYKRCIPGRVVSKGTMDIMVEQSQLQELMSRLLFNPMSGNSFGVEIWHQDTSNSAIVPGMNDDAFVTEKVFFKLKNCYSKRFRTDQPIKGSDQSRSIFLQHLPASVDVFILKCIFPFAVKVAIKRVSEDTKSAVIETRCPTNVQDCLITYTDLEINGRRVSLRAKDFTHAQVLERWERQNAGLSRQIKTQMAKFKPGISKLRNMSKSESEESRSESRDVILETYNEQTPEKVNTKEDISEVTISKQDNTTNRFSEVEKTNRPQTMQEDDMKSIQSTSSCRNSVTTKSDYEDKLGKGDRLGCSQEVRTIEESILRLKKSIKPISEKGCSTTVKEGNFDTTQKAEKGRTPSSDVSKQVSTILHQIKVKANLVPKPGPEESHGRLVLSASPQLSERVSVLLQQIKSQKNVPPQLFNPATAQMPKETKSAKKNVPPQSLKPEVTQVQKDEKPAEIHVSPQSFEPASAQFQKETKSAEKNVPPLSLKPEVTQVQKEEKPAEIHVSPQSFEPASAQFQKDTKPTEKNVPPQKSKPSTLQLQEVNAAIKKSVQSSRPETKQLQLRNTMADKFIELQTPRLVMTQVQGSVHEDKDKWVEKKGGAGHSAEKVLRDKVASGVVKTGSPQKLHPEQSFGAEILDLASLNTSKADKWQKLLPSEAVRQIEKERKEQKKHEQERKEALERERRREEERNLLKRKREEERELQKKRVLARKEKPSEDQGRCLSGREMGGIAKVAITVMQKPSDFGRFSDSEQLMRSEEPVGKGTVLQQFHGPLVQQADVSGRSDQLVWFDQNPGRRDLAHHHAFMQTGVGQQQRGRDAVMAASSIDQPVSADQLRIVIAFEQTVAQGMTVEDTSTLLVTQLWQRGMPRQEAIFRVQQALATARQRQLGKQSLQAGFGERSAFPVSRGMALEEPGVLVSGPSGHKQISNSASGARNFESSATGRSEVFPSLVDSLPKSAFASSRLDRSNMQRLNAAERPGYESAALNRLDARERDVRHLEDRDRSPLRKSDRSPVAKTAEHTLLLSSRFVDREQSLPSLDIQNSLLNRRSELSPAAMAGSQKDEGYGLQGLHKHDTREHHLQSLNADDSRLQGLPNRFPANVGVPQKAAGCSLPKVDRLLTREQILQGLDVGDTANQMGQAIELRVIKDQLQRQVCEQAERLQQQIAILESMERDSDNLLTHQSLLTNLPNQEHKAMMDVGRGDSDHQGDGYLQQQEETRKQDVDMMFEEYEKELHKLRQAQRTGGHSDQPHTSLAQSLGQSIPGSGSLAVPSLNKTSLGDVGSRHQSMEEFNMQQARYHKHPGASYQQKNPGDLFGHELLEIAQGPSRVYKAPVERQCQEEMFRLGEQRHQEDEKRLWQQKLQEESVQTRIHLQEDLLDVRGQRPRLGAREDTLDVRGQHHIREVREDTMNIRGQRPRQEERAMFDLRDQQRNQEARYSATDTRSQQPRPERRDMSDVTGQQHNLEARKNMTNRRGRRPRQRRRNMSDVKGQQRNQGARDGATDTRSQWPRQERRDMSDVRGQQRNQEAREDMVDRRGQRAGTDRYGYAEGRRDKISTDSNLRRNASHQLDNRY